jgi:hypothetical protein
MNLHSLFAGMAKSAAACREKELSETVAKLKEVSSLPMLDGAPHPAILTSGAWSGIERGANCV